MKKLLFGLGLCLSFSLMAQQPPIAKAPIAPAQKGVAVKPAAKVDEKKVALPKVPEKSFYQSFVEPLVIASKKEYQNTKPMRDKIGTFLTSTECRYLRNSVGLYLLASTLTEYNYLRKVEFANGNHNWIKTVLYNKRMMARTIGGIYLSAPVFAVLCDVIKRK